MEVVTFLVVNLCPVYHTTDSVLNIPMSVFCEGFMCGTTNGTPPLHVKQLFMKHIHTVHLNYNHIYTDGSNDEINVGCATLSLNTSITRKLDP